MTDENNLQKKVNSVNSMGLNQKLWETDVEVQQAIADPQVSSSEKLVPIKLLVGEDEDQYEVESAIPVLSGFKERITRTIGMTKWDEKSFYLAWRMYLAAGDLQDITEQEKPLSGLDYTPTCNLLAVQVEGLAQMRKGMDGWAGELLQTRNLNERIHQEQRMEERIQPVEEKKKRFILF